MLFQKKDLSIRYVTENDVQTLSNWLSNPEVLCFYEGRDKPRSPEQVRERYISSSGEKRCIVEYKNKSIGYIQIYPLDPEWKALYGYDERENVWGMDQFIGETAYWNRGIGTELVLAAITYIKNELGAFAIAMDPRVSNERAIRCYEKCGFQKVKVLKEHELHEGVWEDCWIMEYKNEGDCV
ncbi:GNAT family N-acetyltransferase [Bacillus cereus group sp. BfR-BA-01380]|uniref:GNAT family N-acetyltransferase n=1 Tax=Bacillus cereus group sp. BfR-BA-01380 TaxID=2920324 RepID=UPI001F577E25|nr:GNAT family N-acetyltransferase [Bacillus cereus group sp. BfR-BA-01380]